MGKKDEFYKIFQSKGKHHFKQLYLVNKKSFIKGCGSYLFNGKKYIYDETMYEKQKLLYELCKKNNKILEIGTYMGHSVLIMLLANPRIHITSIDINDIYAKPSLEYLQKEFPKSKINFIKNDSLKALNNLKEKFDLFHIDGSHEGELVSKEFLMLINLTKKNRIKIIFDDVRTISNLQNNILKNFQIINNFTPNCIHTNFYVEILVNKKIFKKNLNNFKFENFKIYLKYRLINIFLKKLYYNKITIYFWNSFFRSSKIFRKILFKDKNLIN